jgi:hypothetical protein
LLHPKQSNPGPIFAVVAELIQHYTPILSVQLNAPFPAKISFHGQFTAPDEPGIENTKI